MQKRHFEDEVYHYERELARAGKTPAEILALLKKRFQGSGIATPLSVNAIRRHLSGFPSSDGSGQWSLAGAVGDEGAIVLRFQREWLESAGWWRAVTKLQAEWMNRIDKAAPGLSTYTLLEVATEYINRVELDVPTKDLDAWLAFAPWQSEAGLARYEAALDDGEVPRSIKVTGGHAVGADHFHALVVHSKSIQFTKAEGDVG